MNNDRDPVEQILAGGWRNAFQVFYKVRYPAQRGGSCEKFDSLPYSCFVLLCQLHSLDHKKTLASQA
jgi:hypothetical protein